MKRLLPLVWAFLFALIVCSSAFAVMVESRHQAEAMTDLGDAAQAITEHDESSDDGTHIRFAEIADNADKVRLNVDLAQQMDEISIRARLRGSSNGDDRVAVWVDGTAGANKVGTVLPPKGSTWKTRTLKLSSPISAGSHAVYFGPNQNNDAFIAFDRAAFHAAADTDAPAAPTITEPAEGSTDTDGHVDAAWTNTEAGGTNECSLDSGKPRYSACTSPQHYMSPPDGSYTFRVRQIDVAGNVGAAATRNFSVQVETTDTGSTADTDTDGTADSADGCPKQWGPAANGGCPYPQSTDYDFDGIVDSKDAITGKEAQNTSLSGNPRIKANCKVYDKNRVDLIARTQHLHNQIGNTITTNDSSGKSLFEAGRGTTSCDMPWLTSAGWFPIIENEPVRAVNIYYRAPGDQRYAQDLLVGTELLTPDQSFRCVDSPNEPPFEDSPDPEIYECSDPISIRLDFPDCVDLRYIYDHTRNAVFSSKGVCPSSHPYRIPKVNQLSMYANADGVVPNPLRVSMGTGQWGTWEDLHADYFAALQPEFNEPTSYGDALIELCLHRSEGSASGHPRCGLGG